MFNIFIHFFTMLSTDIPRLQGGFHKKISFNWAYWASFYKDGENDADADDDEENDADADEENDADDDEKIS